TWVDHRGDNNGLLADADTGALTFDFDRRTGFGAAVNVFWLSTLSTELAASWDRPRLDLSAENPEVPTFRLGSVRIIPVSATLQFHPWATGRFDPYVGAGGAYVFFGDLESDDLKVAGFERIRFRNKAAFVANAALNVRLVRRLALNLDAKYIPLKTESTSLFAVGNPESIDLKINPLILAAGLSWRSRYAPQRSNRDVSPLA
ncbi:MAG: OmpW family protein, partial [Armatimonadetes bacterium]|nr:OmpW family protein [Armatimonadota bacterium]